MDVYQVPKHAAAIAAELSKLAHNTYAVPAGAKNIHDHGAPIDAANGAAAFYVHAVTYGAGRGRLEVSVTVPGPWKGRRPEAADKHITVSGDRTPAAIAADIYRKLMPSAVEAMAEWHRQTDQDAMARNARSLTAIALAAAGATIDSDSDKGYSRREAAFTSYSISTSNANGWGSGTISHDGSSVSLELRQVPAELAARILELVTS